MQVKMGLRVYYSLVQNGTKIKWRRRRQLLGREWDATAWIAYLAGGLPLQPTLIIFLSSLSHSSNARVQRGSRVFEFFVLVSRKPRNPIPGE